MKYLALTIPGYPNVQAPGQVPVGGKSTAANILSVGIELLLIGAGIFALCLIILGGYKWMTSSGDQEKLASARSTILFAILGLVLVMISFIFITVLGAFFGINFLNFNF